MLPRLNTGHEFFEIESIVLTTYQDGNLAVIGHARWSDGELEAQRLSVNLAHGQAVESKNLGKGEFFFDVNGGGGSLGQLLDSLLACGWVERTGLMVLSGFVHYPAVRLTDKAVIQL